MRRMIWFCKRAVINEPERADDSYKPFCLGTNGILRRTPFMVHIFIFWMPKNVNNSDVSIFSGVAFEANAKKTVLKISHRLIFLWTLWAISHFEAAPKLLIKIGKIETRNCHINTRSDSISEHHFKRVFLEFPSLNWWPQIPRELRHSSHFWSTIIIERNINTNFDQPLILKIRNSASCKKIRVKN
jgi:hypothetical protein